MHFRPRQNAPYRLRFLMSFTRLSLQITQNDHKYSMVALFYGRFDLCSFVRLNLYQKYDQIFSHKYPDIFPKWYHSSKL